MLVVFLFLRNWRATIVAAVALPLSAIPTFFVMDALGFSLNTVSLLGITLVVGILVVDAIVETENIVRHMHMGRPPYEAALEAADEIGTTVIAISMTIVTVFAPVTILLSRPLAIGGAIFALQAIDKGADRAEATLDAGHMRARPIGMTTIAMTAGMIPTALAHGAGGENRAPMAIAVIGGLLVSTLLSRLFVPSLLSVMDGLWAKMTAGLVWAPGSDRATG